MRSRLVLFVVFGFALLIGAYVLFRGSGDRLISAVTGRPSTNFNWDEFACEDEHSGIVTPVPERFRSNVVLLCSQLEVVRAYLGCPLHIISGYRTPTYNASDGDRATWSQHMVAKAADIEALAAPGMPQAAVPTHAQVYDAVQELRRTKRVRFGFVQKYDWGTHVDVGPSDFVQRGESVRLALAA